MKKYTAKALHPDASEMNHAAYKAGCTHFKAHSFKKAISSFEEALSYWPKDAQAWMALGNCYDELRKPKDAEKCFRRALQYASRKNKNAIAFNLGNSLLDQKKYKAAIAFYSSISKKSDVHRIAQKNLIMAREGVTVGKEN